MSSGGHKILRDVLALPAEERADIAVRLLESLDNGADAGVDEAWAAEVEKRCAALDAGEAVTSDWHDVRRRIETQLPQQVKRLRVEAAAEEELSAAVAWYEDRRPGLGSRFAPYAPLDE